MSSGSGLQNICPDGEISVSIAGDLIFCWGPGMVSVDHRWQINTEPGQISWPNTLSLQISRLRFGEETPSPAISPCLWAPSSDPDGSGAWPSLAWSLWCSKETPWPRARRLKGRSWHSIPSSVPPGVALSGSVSSTLCPYCPSCLPQTLRPQEA